MIETNTHFYFHFSMFYHKFQLLDLELYECNAQQIWRRNIVICVLTQSPPGRNVLNFIILNFLVFHITDVPSSATQFDF